MDMQALEATVRDFAAERNWRAFHTPKNLAMALMVEAAELLEIFQWLTPDESVRAADDPARRQHIGHEIADVLIYLVQLAEHTGVDIGAAVLNKLAINARKYPVTQTVNRTVTRTLTRTALQRAAEPDLPTLAQALVPADVHVLLDFENVQPTDVEVRALVPQAHKLWVFHGPHQKQVIERFAAFDKDLTAVPISKTGKNALDFHLSFYMGYIAARNPGARFVVLANDKGYEPMLEHARALGFDVRAIGVKRVAKARSRRGGDAPISAKAPAGKAVARAKAKETATVRKASVGKAPASVPSKVAVKAPVKAAARTRANLPANLPAKVPAKVPAKTTPPRKAVAAAPAKPVARKRAPARAPVKAVADTRAPGDMPITVKLEQGLLKLGSKRPSRLARLRGVVKSFLGSSATDDEVTVALGRLIAASVVDVDSAGHVSYPGWSHAG